MNARQLFLVSISITSFLSLNASVPSGLFKLTSGIFANGGQALDVAIQTGAGGSGQAGKIVMCGYTYVGGQTRWTVARFTVDGVLDTTFNGTGYWQSSNDGSMALCLTIAFNNDNIFVGGLGSSGDSSALMMRFQATDGSVGAAAFPGLWDPSSWFTSYRDG